MSKFSKHLKCLVGATSILTLLSLMPAIAQDAGKYANGRTTVLRLEANGSNGHMRTVFLSATVTDGTDCIAMAGGESWERFCELAAKNGGPVSLDGSLSRLAPSVSVHEGAMTSLATGFSINARIYSDENGHYLLPMKEGGGFGPMIAFTSSRAEVAPTFDRSNDMTASHYNAGASFQLELGERDSEGRNAALKVGVENSNDCLALVPDMQGWEYACEIADKAGTEQVFEGKLYNSGSVGIGLLETADGAALQIWVGDSRQDYALVALRRDSQPVFSGGQPQEAVIFSGQALGSENTQNNNKPLVDVPGNRVTARRVGVDFLGKVELEAVGSELSASLSLNAAARGEMEAEECVRMMGFPTNAAGFISRICERAAKAAPYTMAGTLNAMPNRANAYWGKVVDKFGNDLRMMVVNARENYAEVALTTIDDPGFIKERYVLVPYDDTAADEEIQKPIVALDGDWLIDFGPKVTLTLTAADNDGYVGQMNFPAYSGADCLIAGGRGVIDRICESADKDGARQYTLEGTYRSGWQRAWDFTADFPGDSGFEILMGSSIRDATGLDPETPYLRFGSLPEGPGNVTYHPMQRTSQTRNAVAEDPLFRPELGRVPTCGDMQAKMLEMLGRRAELTDANGNLPFDNIEYVVETVLRDIRNQMTDPIKGCADTYAWLETNLQNQIDLTTPAGGNQNSGNGTTGGAGGAGGPERASMEITFVGGKPVLMVPSPVCESDVASILCRAVKAGPNEGFAITSFSSSDKHAWGAVNINGQDFAMRMTAGQNLQFIFYAESGAERF